MKVGDHEVLGELGRGGMGVVYRVRTPGGEAALKLLGRLDPAAFARFERERRLLAALGEAEGFVGLLDAGRSAQGPWLLMPLVPGGTLRQRLEAGPLGIEESIDLGIQLATALGKAHARGIVHRDVKPENVLFAASGRALVADLGLGKHFDRTAASQSVSLSKHGELRGTVGYMAPEQLEDSASVGPSADVFALGAVLYECLTGRLAFQGETVVEVMTRVSGATVEPIGRAEVPAWLEAVVKRALAVDPAVRFRDGASLARALRQRGGAAERPRALVSLLAGAVAGALLLAILFLASGRTPPPAPPLAERPLKSPVAAEDLQRGLRRAGRNVPAADGKDVPLFLFRLPDGSDMEMVHVPAGDFVMGSSPEPNVLVSETPRHVHRMPRGYWIGRDDVTWAQYRAFCSRTGRTEATKPTWWEQVPGTKDDHPVVNVSWDDASDYAKWAGLALPTEAEWEKAARGTDGRKWPWGNEWDPGACNFADASCPLDTMDVGGKTQAQVFMERGLVWDREHSDGYAYTSPVGRFPRGVSPCGALDMAGNVWQWCDDWFEQRAYERYEGADESVPASGQYRTDRGGSWNTDAHDCRCSERGALPPELRYDTFGFRVVLRC